MGEPSNNNSVLEKLARLQRLFYEQLPDKLYQLETYWQQLRQGEAEHVISDFHRAAHGLAGAAGTFGAITVGTVARELEMALKPMLGLGNKSSIRIDAALVDVVDGVLARLRRAAQQWHPNKNFQLIPDVESESRREFSDLIYLLEDDVLQAEKIRVNLEYNDFHVRCFSRLVDFERACDEQLPAAIVMDMVLDEGCTAGAKAIEVLKQRFSICPPVVFISVRTDIEARLAAARAGALRYFSKPLDLDALTQTLNGLTRQVTSPYHVLIIDDDEQLLEYYATILRQAGMDV
ncbi:MAG TPA: response regulator, partial [Candidatus Tenderia electrophaga]|nr:response regulator [Candidatus Tenderia electrophaga]